MEMEEMYLEDQNIVLPNIVDGPTAIGDLWDCQKSKLVGMNLFGKQLDSQHLQANAIKELKYNLTHVRSTTDRHKFLQVSGEVALELLGGLIKVGGGAEYESDEQSYASEEELLCHYDLKTFSVKALPSAKEVMDQLVTEKLLRGEIKATHVAMTTILGAEVTASVRIRETKSSSKEDIKGHFFGKLIVGPISASAKVALGKLDTSESDDFEKKIKVDSKPFFNSQPVTVKEMFEFIEGIGKKVEEEKHPAFLNAKDSVASNIFGVPLRFYLVPIKHFLDIPVEKLYMQIKDEVLEKMCDILATLTDFQNIGYLKKRILESEPRLKLVLLDQNNPLAVKISQREKEIRLLAKRHYSASAEMLKGYKIGKFDQQDLLKLAHEIDHDINVTSVFEEIHGFTSEGRIELLGIHEGDIVDTHQLKIFTNNMDMMEWYQTQKPFKLLLRTGGNCVSNGHVTCLYDISGLLKDLGMEIGIATPAISDGRHDLSIKIDDVETIYLEEEISFVIKILLLVVNKADETSTRLFTIYASQNGLMLPFQKHLTYLHSMIKILSEIKQIKIADSYLKLRDLALEKDGQWKFIMDLNTFDSAAETINKFRHLHVQLSEFGGEWIVGNFGIESSTGYSNGPLLFIFKDKKLKAVCFDNVDILLLIQAFKQNGERLFKLLYPDQITLEKSCLHGTRADVALKVIQLFQSSQSSLEDAPKISKVGPFSSAINKSIEAIQVLVRSFVAKDDISLWGAMANIMTNHFPDAKTILKSHTWIDEVNGHPAGFKNVNPQELAAALKEFLSTQDPFYAKVQVVFESVSYFHTSEKKEPEVVHGFINTIAADINCPEQLKEQLLSCQEITDNSRRFERVEQILKRHLEAVKGSKYETVTLFIKLLEISTDHLEDFFGTELLPKLIAQLDVDETKYPTFHTKLLTSVDVHNYYMVLHILAQIQFLENDLFLVSNQFEALTSLTDDEPLCQILGKKTADKLSLDHFRWLFTNPKFIFLLENNSNCSQLLQTIKFFHCPKLNIPDYIPECLKERLQPMMEEDDGVDCPDIIPNLNQAINILQRIIAQNRVPDNFGKVLGDSVAKNFELKTAFEMAKALFYWCEERQLFTETWNCETINDAYNLLIEWKRSLDYNQSNEQDQVSFHIEISSETDKLPDIHTEEDSEEQQHEPDSVCRTKSWHSLLGSYSYVIEPRNFLKIQSILPEPRIESDFKEGYIVELLPYILQRLKMWGIHVIQQENLAKLGNSPVTSNKKGFIKFVFNENIPQSVAQTGNSANFNSNCPISRIDILACLNAVCHSIVFQDLLRIMAQFPVALPLVLQEMSENACNYVCLIPLLKSISVKWEVQPGVVMRNQLFTNPFKLIVALRVGSPTSGSSGKSTVLNQVMGTKHMFSSLAGPGAGKGIPVTLHGSVELAVLLQETCSSALWESVVKSHYLSGSHEVLMLANIHGDVLELSETVELLKNIASSFIVFFMPCTRIELQERSMKIQKLLFDTEDIVFILVDPTPECTGQPTHTINTNQLTLDNTLETVRSALNDAIQMGSPRHLKALGNITNKIRLSPDIFTETSEGMLTYVKTLSSKRARSVLQLQKVNPKYTNNYSALVMAVWEKEANLRDLIKKFVLILNLPIKSRLLAFAHLDRELSLLTASESLQVREKLGKLQEQRRRALNLEGGSELSTEQKMIMEQIRLTMDELDDMNLGMEHLYRELGRIYQAIQSTDAPKNEPILSLPRRYAELLICGHAIEILDGDIGDMCGPWLNSICHSVCESYPDLRIFTLSIIGLQSSGKSTLLNALFACKFAVSVGRCTRGLFMRIIFLDKSLADELEIDAILLIDTEGLGAPEKLNDPEAEHKDRLLATFAMSVSNLTLINVLGESVRDLTDILQIVIVTMARLEKADISPDILMVQHLSERDSSKTMKGADEFCKALEEAVALTDSADMAIGVRNCKSLRNLEARVKNGQLLKQFRPFKNGASANAPPSQEYHEDVIDLYKTILNSCKQVTSPHKFHKWHELIQNYWAAVSIQDFSLRFKNIQEVHEFIDRGSAIAKTKEALDAAFRVHRESCETKIRQKVNELANNAEGIRNWEKEKESELQSMREVLKWIPHACDPPCPKCSEAMSLKNQLFRDLEGKNCQQETEATINIYIQKTREFVAKHLSQMAEAIWVKHGYTCEFDAIIGSILMEKLKDEPNPSESKRKKMVDEVWSRVERQISQKVQVASAKRRIYNEVKEEYAHATAVSKHFYKETTTKDLPKLGDIKAIDFSTATKVLNKMKDVISYQRQHTYLDYKQVSFLESKLDELPNRMLNIRRTDHFEDGMVRMLGKYVNDVLEEFETKHTLDGKLAPEFKWEVHVFAILKFVDAMADKQHEWDRNNNPYYILRQNEDTYRKKIYIRIKHGFGFEAEGRIIGDLLLKAIRKLGQKQGDRTYIDHVRSVNWLTSSENVRLTYFSKLAQQVEKGDKEQTLKHFRNPKAMIEAWFKKEVDSLSPEVGKTKFIETVESELGLVIQEIRNQKSCERIKAFVTSYFTKVEDIEYNPEVDLDSGSATDFDLLQTVILNKLDEDKESLKLRITLINPSACSEVKNLLGCTEHCYWCGSLCWGQVRHGENTDNTKKHHACHQPEGLSGCSHKYEQYLISTCCDSTGDDWNVYWHSCTEGMTWLQAKSHPDFENWTFTSHHKSEFNELMKWFFYKLHNDIANSKSLKPARHNDLSDNGFFNLVTLDHILATIKTRI